MVYQECREFLAPQGRKDNKEKMELRGSLVSRDREVWREQEDKKEIQGHLVPLAVAQTNWKQCVWKYLNDGRDKD